MKAYLKLFSALLFGMIAMLVFASPVTAQEVTKTVQPVVVLVNPLTLFTSILIMSVWIAAVTQFLKLKLPDVFKGFFAVSLSWMVAFLLTVLAWLTNTGVFENTGAIWIIFYAGLFGVFANLLYDTGVVKFFTKLIKKQ
jgi:hypothetical protein